MTKGQNGKFQEMTDAGICLSSNKSAQPKQSIAGPSGGLSFVANLYSSWQPPLIQHSALDNGIRIHANGEWTPALMSEPILVTAGQRAAIKVQNKEL